MEGISRIKLELAVGLLISASFVVSFANILKPFFGFPVAAIALNLV